MAEWNLSELLHAERAKVVEDNLETLTTDREVKRSWDKLPNGCQEEARAYLAATKTYTDPVLSGLTLTGTWRSAEITFQQSGGGLRCVETLRLGYLETLLSGEAVDWSEAHLAQGVHVDADEQTHLIEWRNIAPSKVHTVAQQLSADSYTNVSADGTAISGTWYNVRVETQLANDGSGIVRVLLSLEYRSETTIIGDGTLKPETNVYYFNVPDGQIATVLALAGSAGDRENISTTITSYDGGFANIRISTTTISTVTSDEIVAVAYDETETQTCKWNRTLAEIADDCTALGLSTAEPGKTKSLFQVSNGDGTYDIVAKVSTKTLTESVTVSSLAAIDAAARDLIQYGEEAEVRIYTWYSVSADNIATIRTSLLGIDIDGWKVQRIDEEYRPSDGTYTVRLTIAKIGTEEHQIKLQQIDAETQSITVRLLNRAEEPSDPTVEGYVLVSEDKEERGENLTTYTYYFDKIGTSTTLEIDNAQPTSEAERVTRILFNRTSEPTAPIVAGYSLVGSRVQRQGEVHSDYLFEYQKQGSTAHSVRQVDIGGEAALAPEVKIVELRNRTATPVTPTEDGYVCTAIQVDNPDEVLQHYTYTLEREGTVTHTVLNAEFGVEAERRRLILKDRESTPDTPTVTGYTLIDKSIAEPDSPLSDYIFDFEKDGTTNHQVETREESAEVEIRAYACLRRASAPTTPVIAGFTCVRKDVQNPGQAHSDYLFYYVRNGTSTDLVTRKRYPDADAEVIEYTYYKRASEPSEPTISGYTLIDIETSGRDGLLTDYTYRFAKNSTVSGIGLTLIGSTTPYFMERQLYVEPNVTDENLATRIAYLKNSANWGADEIVEDVDARYNGIGLTDIYVRIVVLPATWTDDRYEVDGYDGPFKGTVYTLYTRRYGYATDHDDDTGKESAWNSFDVVDAQPTGGLAGRCIRQKRIQETISFHKTEPDITAVSGAFASHSYQGKRKDPHLGYWVKTVMTTTIGNWASSL